MIHACAWSNCLFVVTPTGIFNVLLEFFFVITPCPRLYGPRCNPFPYLYGARYNPAIARLWRCNSSSWRRVALLSLITFATPAAPPINDPSAHNIGKIGNIQPLLEVFVFSLSFSSLRLHFHLHIHAGLCFGFHCRSNDCRSSFLSDSQISRNNTYFRAFSASFVGHVFREIVAMRIGYVVLAIRRVHRVNTSIASDQSLS